MAPPSVPTFGRFAKIRPNATKLPTIKTGNNQFCSADSTFEVSKTAPGFAANHSDSLGLAQFKLNRQPKVAA